MAHPVQGIIPPLTTPFTPTGEVYEQGLRQLVDFQVEKGVHALFICGTYGSGAIMSLEERRRVHEIVVEQVRRRITVIAHVGTASTVHSVQLARHAESVGVDYLSCVPPFYHGHDDREVVEHYRAVVKAVKVPVYAYNNPKASGYAITPSCLRRLYDVGVLGIKDSAFSYIEYTNLVLAMQDRPHFAFIIGTEALALPALMIGAQGCVSGIANIFPETMVKLWDLFKAGKYQEAAQQQLLVSKARQVMSASGSTNAACYAGLAARGIDAGMPKPPVLPLPEEKAAGMLAGFRAMGLL